MRINIVYGVIIFVWIILLTRVYYLSIKSNEYYEQIAEKNAIKTEYIAPVRGQILDRNGKPLAVNKLGFEISIRPHLRRNIDILDEEIEFIISVFPDLNAAKLKREYIKNDSPYSQDFVNVVNFLDYDRVLPHFARLNLRDNIEVRPVSIRYYPFGDLASHVIGYVGRANLKDIETNPISKFTNYTGRSGVERYYNEILQGVEGQKITKVTALNKIVEEMGYIKPHSIDISLTIDLELQKYLYEAFDRPAGAVIVMDALDGSILAAASLPEYDLNQFVTGISQSDWNEMMNNLEHPFTNKLVNALYPPGSVVKMAMGMAFFESGKISPTTKLLCDPYFELGNRKFRNWKNYGSEMMTIVDALRDSCDTYFYRGAYSVGIEAMAPVLRRYGFGVKTGVDLPNEYIGIVPDIQWKKNRLNQPWYQGDTINTSIGQGSFLATPMQVARDTAILAMGYDVTPHFLDSVNDIKQDWVGSDILTQKEKSALKYIREGMYAVANIPSGTGFRVLSPSKVTIAAKSGTAQVVGISQEDKERIKEEDMEYYERSHAWMTGYAPYENPRYVVTVLVEHGASGGGAAGPILARIFDKLADMGYIDAKYHKKRK